MTELGRHLHSWQEQMAKYHGEIEQALYAAELLCASTKTCQACPMFSSRGYYNCLIADLRDLMGGWNTSATDTANVAMVLATLPKTAFEEYTESGNDEVGFDVGGNPCGDTCKGECSGEVDGVPRCPERQQEGKP